MATNTQTLHQETQPRWVIVDGILHAVSDFAHIKNPKKRPPAFCPVCEDAVIFKLGPERAHHYAHKPDVTCATTNPETALHLNVKYYLYDQLKNADKIFIEEKCTWGCGTTRQREWLRDWDDVQVEHSIDAFRPDVTLFLTGQPIGALEVLVSHKVSRQKADYFQEKNIPVIELLADDGFYLGESRWTADKPLPFFYRLFPPEKAWVCESCLDKLHRREQVPDQAEPEIAETVDETIDENKSRREIVGVSVVDFYYKSGKKYREIYVFLQEYVAGQVKSIWVRNRIGQTLFFDNQPESETLSSLQQHIKDEIFEKTLDGTIADIVSELDSWGTGRKVSARDFRHIWHRFQWNDDVDEWVNVITIPQPAIQPTMKTPDNFPEVRSSFLNPKALPCEICGELKFSHQYTVSDSQKCICRECLKKKEWPVLHPKISLKR